jgi:hypothetical protein
MKPSHEGLIYLLRKIKVKTIKTLLIILCWIPTSSACIWQSQNKSGNSPFWPSNNIEVCFTPATAVNMMGVENPLDLEYRQMFQRNIQVIKETLERQINARTNLNLSGFAICPPLGQAPPSMIRIDINGTQGSGAMAASIGPRSAKDEVNVNLNSLDQQWPGGQKPDMNSTPLPARIRTFNDRRQMSWVSLHEVMHLLGFHHSEYWDKDMSGADIDIAAVTQVGDGLDPYSVMTRGFRSIDANGFASLSERDVACLNKVADRSILEAPSRQIETENRRIFNDFNLPQATQEK